jgi:hypothetical protein
MFGSLGFRVPVRKDDCAAATPSLAARLLWACQPYARRTEIIDQKQIGGRMIDRTPPSVEKEAYISSHLGGFPFPRMLCARSL